MLRIDRDKLLSLLTDFYSLTTMKICVFDEEGNEISGVPEHLCAFCGYVRSSPAGESACLASDRHAFEVCRRTGEPYVYRCHMGLTECVSPIMQQGRCIGFIMLGQTASGDGKETFRLRQHLLRYGLDADRGVALYATIRFSPDEKVRAAVSILEACAGYLYLHKLVSADDGLWERTDAYIRAGLRGDLSVEALCRLCHLSRADLYVLFRQRVDMTPAAYVRQVRMNEAKTLLETPLSVTEVAHRVGVCDYNYFSKLFRSAVGVSPRTYRRSRKP